MSFYQAVEDSAKDYPAQDIDARLRRSFALLEVAALNEDSTTANEQRTLALRLLDALSVAADAPQYVNELATLRAAQTRLAFPSLASNE